MLIEKAKIESRIFNLDNESDQSEYNALIDNPGVRILDKRWIDHNEVHVEGRERTEVKEPHLYVEWEECSL